MTITTTLGKLIDNYDWEEVCEVLGLNEWCLNEGLAHSYDEVELTLKQAEKIGLKIADCIQEDDEELK